MEKRGNFKASKGDINMIQNRRNMLRSIKEKMIEVRQKDEIQRAKLSPLIIILHNYRSVYFSIPKVASSSWHRICAILLNFDISEADIKNDARVKGLPYIKKSEVSGYEDYFKFCFVRNPFDRLVSCYLNKIAAPDYSGKGFEKGVNRIFFKYGNLFEGGMSFEKFVNAVAEIPDLDSDRHFRSQHTFITNSTGKEVVNFIGKIENSHKDFQYVLKRLNREDILVPYFKRNADRQPYQDFFNTKNIVNTVRKRYAKDIEIFDYKF